MTRQVRILETRVIRVNNRSTMLHCGKVYDYQPALDGIIAQGHAEFVGEETEPAAPAAEAGVPAKDARLRRRAHPLLETPRDPVRNGGFSED